jgi:hypothetical protein
VPYFGDSANAVLAYTLQFHSNLYKTLFDLFAPPPKGEKKTCIHLNANICQSLVVYPTNRWILHLWEPQKKYYYPGLTHAAKLVVEASFDGKTRPKVLFFIRHNARDFV